jgi:hypothetical protein
MNSRFVDYRGLFCDFFVIKKALQLPVWKYPSTLNLRDDEGKSYRYWNEFTLTSVSSERPNTSVPEPATYL